MALSIEVEIILMLVAALGCALVAGIFFAFSNFVMKALIRVPPEHGISAMQSINVTVLNPWFFGLFLGTGVICIVTAIFLLFDSGHPGAVPALAGCATYVAGTILVTILFNIPRNESLATLNAADPESVYKWVGYVSGWTRWNHVRTIASAVASALFLIAIRAW